ncbi:MAG: class I SAM-dependent methyltransferase [Planctomycetota bacterium]|jgi:hypothetical protein
MLKFGVYDINQLREAKDVSIFGGVKKVSVSLLDDALREEEPDRTRLYERIMFELNDDRGAFKRTTAARFQQFDQDVLALLQSLYSGRDDPLRVHDTAVSNGQTAVDFFAQLSVQFPQLDYLASDYDPYIRIAKRGTLSVALSSHDQVIEITRPPFVFTPKQLESPLFYPANHIIRHILQRLSVRRLLNDLSAEEQNDIAVRNVNLFCPSAQALATEDARFSLAQYSLLDDSPTEEKFDCIRAMNVINKEYFSDAEMGRIFQNLASALKPQGLLIVGSNHESGSAVAGGVYQLNENQFSPLWISSPSALLSDCIGRYNNR